MARPPRRRAGAPRSLVPPPTTAAVSAAWSQRLVARMNLLSPLLVPLLCTAVAYAAVVALGRGNYTDPYYATAVQSMLHNWHNFIFLSFDRAGFLSVDKPPVDLWLQTLSARILGLGDTSLVLPQALAGGFPWSMKLNEEQDITICSGFRPVYGRRRRLPGRLLR